MDNESTFPTLEQARAVEEILRFNPREYAKILDIPNRSKIKPDEIADHAYRLACLVNPIVNSHAQARRAYRRILRAAESLGLNEQHMRRIATSGAAKEDTCRLSYENDLLLFRETKLPCEEHPDVHELYEEAAEHLRILWRDPTEPSALDDLKEINRRLVALSRREGSTDLTIDVSAFQEIFKQARHIFQAPNTENIKEIERLRQEVRLLIQKHQYPATWMSIMSKVELVGNILVSSEIDAITDDIRTLNLNGIKRQLPPSLADIPSKILDRMIRMLPQESSTERISSTFQQLCERVESQSLFFMIPLQTRTRSSTDKVIQQARKRAAWSFNVLKNPQSACTVKELHIIPDPTHNGSSSSLDLTESRELFAMVLNASNLQRLRLDVNFEQNGDFFRSFPRLTDLQVTPNQVKHLVGLSLEKLTVVCEKEGEGAFTVRDLPLLTDLNLIAPNRLNSTVPLLDFDTLPALRRLGVSQGSSGDEYLKYSGTPSSIRLLSLSRVGIPPVLLDQCDNLRHLHLQGYFQGLPVPPLKLKNLETLELLDCNLGSGVLDGQELPALKHFFESVDERDLGAHRKNPVAFLSPYSKLETFVGLYETGALFLNDQRPSEDRGPLKYFDMHLRLESLHKEQKLKEAMIAHPKHLSYFLQPSAQWTDNLGKFEDKGLSIKQLHQLSRLHCAGKFIQTLRAQQVVFARDLQFLPFESDFYSRSWGKIWFGHKADSHDGPRVSFLHDTDLFKMADEGTGFNF